MRAARRPDGKYIRNERIGDEAYRLADDAAELENRAGADDPRIGDVEHALAAFETRVGGAWIGAAGDDVTDAAVDEMDEEARERLRQLGYLE
jgi:hypothetical protein